MLIKFWYWLTRIESCRNCEILKDLLADERIAKEQLLKSLLEINKPQIVMVEPEKELPKAILPQSVPWRVRQQMLQAEDKKRAEIVREHDESFAELEKSLGITNAS